MDEVRRAMCSLGARGVGGCAARGDGRTQAFVSLLLNLAWMDGRKVEYVTTDVSDVAMADAQ